MVKIPPMETPSDNVTIVIKDFDSSIHIHALMNGRKIGYVYLTRINEVKVKLADILVQEGYQRIGIGNMLINEAIQIARGLGKNEIYGTMIGDTNMLTYFYKKHDFEMHDGKLSLSLLK
ncbi:GNAT family N-acetyltransferase [Klebsiella oxytoca]|uniref:GNAT family N-acetyltransferase n=1 Tax=Klebsiella oxytoca TaxID=571 RepID=UPI0039C905D1